MNELIHLLQKCTSITSLKTARQLHALILKSSTPCTYPQPFLHNSILSLYANSGSLFHAHRVFDQMPQRNFISYNSIISACAHYSQFPFYTVRLFSQLRDQCFWPDGATYSCLLESASTIRDWFLGLTLHSLTVKSGVLFDVTVQTALLGFYSGLGDLSSTDEVFKGVEVKDSYCWDCVVSVYMKCNRMEESLSIFRRMVWSGLMPTELGFSMVLSACARLSDYKGGQSAHAHLTSSGVLVDLPLQNALVDMYASCGDTRSAFCVFNGIQDPDIVSWNSLMVGCAGNGEGEKSVDLFLQLKCRAMHKPDEYTFAAVISAVEEYPAHFYGEPLHAQAIVCGWDKSGYVGSPLISMYFENKRNEYAERVFHSIPQKDVALWTDVMSGYSKMLDYEKAVNLFCSMWRGGHKVDDFYLSIALSACAATLRQSEMLHGLAIKAGCSSAMSVCGSLIDTYIKNGSLQAAESTFAEVPNPGLSCWNSIIGGYGHHGMAEKAMDLFYEMLVRGLKPNQVSYNSLLSACSRSEEKGFSPGLQHYSWLVNLLSRAGLLEEAVKLFNESEVCKNNIDLWRTVLNSSVANKNLSMGLEAARKILELDSHDIPTYTLISNLYADVGNLQGVLEIRKRIRALRLEKDPGLSRIGTMKRLDVFSSGDMSHQRIEEVKPQLQMLQ